MHSIDKGEVLFFYSFYIYKDYREFCSEGCREGGLEV